MDILLAVNEQHNAKHPQDKWIDRKKEVREEYLDRVKCCGFYLKTINRKGGRENKSTTY